MDGKKCLILFLIALCSCQKQTKQDSKVIDDSNSNFSSKTCYGTAIPKKYLIHWKNGEISVVRGLDKTEIIKKFQPQLENEIDFIEQDRYLSAQMLKTTQAYMNNNPIQIEAGVDYWGQQRVEAPAVWSKKILGENVTVAIVDSGVDISHPQLKNQVLINLNEIPDNQIDDDHNGFVDDVYGYDFYNQSANIIPVGIHGTHVAGIIAADPAFGPIIGMAPRAKILPLNFMEESGGGSLGDAILAMEYAVQRGAKIINASWGGAPCADSLKKEIDKLTTNNILFVVASGNSGADLDINPEYPAAYHADSQITVGAVVLSDRMAGYSNYSEHLVDIMAPGSIIWSTVPMNKLHPDVPSVQPLNGTSMAAPFVSGAAALLWSQYPNATLNQIKDALIKSVDIGQYPVLSKGRLNVKKAVEYLNLESSKK